MTISTSLLHARPTPRAALAVGLIFAVAGAALGISMLPAASAPAFSLVTSDGRALDGAAIAPGTPIEVRGGSASEVSFVLDGRYLGKDLEAPFALFEIPGEGEHSLRARIETDSDKQVLRADFVVSAAPVPDVAPRTEALRTTPRTTTAAPTTTAPRTTAPMTTAPKTTAPSTTAPAPPKTTPKLTAATAPTPGAPTPAAPPTGSVIDVRTAAELTAALAAVNPGQTIRLADGAYSGKFVATRASTASAPIRLIGSRAAVLSNPGVKGVTLHLNGASHWSVEGFTISGGQKGVVVDAATRVTLAGLDVGKVGMEAIHLRTHTTDSVVRGNLVHDTGLSSAAYGEGIYIGTAESNWGEYTGGKPDASNRNTVSGNTILRTTAEPIDIKEGSSDGVIIDNVIDGSAISGANFADSYIDVKGNGYTVARNVLSAPSSKTVDAITTHEVVDGWGVRNVFSANELRGQVKGYTIKIVSASSVVRCDNIKGSAAKGLSNVPCS